MIIKSHYLTAAIFILAAAVFAVIMLIYSSKEWVMPESLVGTWSSKQEITIRFSQGVASFRFVKSTVNIVMNIHADGSVDGTAGGAKFEGCSVAKNRNWLFKLLGLFTDYKIRGRLIGRTFAEDTLTKKEIDIPFNMKDNIIDGTIFHSSKMEAFRMVNIHLTKQQKVY
jgi:hypothetical protein